MWKKITENEFSFSIPGKSFKIETVVLPVPDKNGKITKYKANVLFKGFLVLEKENSNKNVLTNDIKKRLETMFK
jgi:hypothetical protein